MRSSPASQLSHRKRDGRPAHRICVRGNGKVTSALVPKTVMTRIGAVVAGLGVVAASAVAVVPQAAADHPSEGGGSLGAPEDLDGRWASPTPVGKKVCPTKSFWVGDGWGVSRGSRKHRGIDLAADRGTPIFAVEDGRINRTKRQANGALQIVLKGASGPKYYYGHMDEVFINGGDKVVAGQVIGTMGDTGSPGAVHLHFEYWKSGRESAAVNPKKFVTRICRL